MLLQRGPSGDFVSRAWEGKAVVCIATGPSLTAAQIETVRRAREADAVRVIAINDAFLLAPFADVLFFADTKKFYGWYEQGLARAWPWTRFDAAQTQRAFAEFRGQKCTVRDKAGGVFTLKVSGTTGLSENPGGLHTGQNGGHMALNLAFLSGGKPILLLAYDGKRGPRGEEHGFGKHPDKSEPPYLEMAQNMRGTVKQLNAAGAAVFNCTPGSAVDCFPRKSLDECLALTA